VACTSLACTIVGTTYTRAAFTTLERYFGVNTKTLAFYTAVNQFVSLFFTPVLVNLTKHMNIPRVLWLSFGQSWKIYFFKIKLEKALNLNSLAIF